MTEPAVVVGAVDHSIDDAVASAPGRLVGGTYRLAGPIGGGAMGVVFLAVDVRLGRNVALKMIRASLLEPGFRALFRQEARAMALVNHPNVITIYSFGEDEGVPYFAMELVHGRSLDRLLEDAGGDLPLDLSLSLLDQACRGISAIHEVGTVHRDIKPGNLLVDSESRLRVGDLGLATPTEPGPALRGVVGTPGYIAPEVLLGLSDATPRSDIYSLACVAYELLTGQPPFRGPREELSARHLTQTPEPPSRLRARLPAALDQVLLTAMAKEPRDRPATVEQFRANLARTHRNAHDPARILLVEDDDDQRALLELALVPEFPWAEIECVADGAAALEAFARKPPSVVVTDLQMPGVDGRTLTASLRSRPDAIEVPIIMLTASGGSEEWRQLSAMGADRFVVKPVNVEDLAGSIRGALRERRARHQ